MSDNEDQQNDEDARSDVTYFDLDAVDEDDEVEISEPANKKQKSNNETTDDIDAASDISEFSDGDPEIPNIEPTEDHCRLCLTECSSTDAWMADYADAYSFCTSYSIYHLDVPKRLCSDCKKKLLDFCSFRKRCKRIEFILDDFSKQSEIQIEFEPPPEDASDNETEAFVRDQDAIDEQIRKCLEGPRPKKEKPPPRARGRPRVEKPMLPKRPIGRPRGSAYNKRESDGDGEKRFPGRPVGSFAKHDDPQRKPLGRPKGSKNHSFETSDCDPNSSMDSEVTDGAKITVLSNKRMKVEPSIGEGLDVLRGDIGGGGKRGPKPGTKKGPRPDSRKYQACDDRILCQECGRVFLESERKNMYNHMHKHRVEKRQAAAMEAKLKEEAEQDFSTKEVYTKVEYLDEAPLHVVEVSSPPPQNHAQVQSQPQQQYYRQQWG